MLRMMMMRAMPGAADSAAEGQRRTISVRWMDESCQGTRRAVAKAVAFPLRIQPSIDNHCRLLLQIGQLLGYYSYKSYALHSVLQGYPGHRRKMIP
jgi:hypothetical protein